MIFMQITSLAADLYGHGDLQERAQKQQEQRRLLVQGTSLAPEYVRESASFHEALQETS